MSMARLQKELLHKMLLEVEEHLMDKLLAVRILPIKMAPA
jgi:hypothetical protein